jgi:hypothetical protein
VRKKSVNEKLIETLYKIYDKYNKYTVYKVVNFTFSNTSGIFVVATNFSFDATLYPLDGIETTPVVLFPRGFPFSKFVRELYQQVR